MAGGVSVVQTIIERISNRWIHAPSGRTYAYDYNPPKKHGVDDVTGKKQRLGGYGLPLVRSAEWRVLMRACGCD